MIKCPYCGKAIEINGADNIEAKIWNFDGESSDVEMVLYCENCEELCDVEIHFNMIPTKIKRISKRG